MTSINVMFILNIVSKYTQGNSINNIAANRHLIKQRHDAQYIIIKSFSRDVSVPLVMKDNRVRFFRNLQNTIYVTQ